MMMASVISRAARNSEFSGAGGDGVAGGLKHIPMAMTRITCRHQQPLSMLLSITCVEPAGSWVQRSTEPRKMTINHQERSCCVHQILGFRTFQRWQTPANNHQQPSNNHQRSSQSHALNLDGGFNKSEQGKNEDELVCELFLFMRITFVSLQLWDRNNIVMPPFAIRIGSRVVMKAKEGAKGTVLEAIGKHTWNVKWDDGKSHNACKLQQLKEEPKADAPPASLTVAQRKCRLFLRLIVSDQFSSHAVVPSQSSWRQPSSHHHHGGSCWGKLWFRWWGGGNGHHTRKCEHCRWSDSNLEDIGWLTITF
jgi:hypothetical protein